MIEMVEANWLLILLAFLIGLAIAWYVFNVRRRTRVTADRRDVLDEGAERAKRNQAFIDAPAQLADQPPQPQPTQISSPPAPVAQPVARTPAPPAASGPVPGSIAGAGMAAGLAAGVPEAVSRSDGEAEEKESGDNAAVDVHPVHIPVKPMAEPAGEQPEATRSAKDNDLNRLKGIGPKLAAQLNALGITRLEQIAAWNEAEIDRVDAQLGRFQGRIRRDDWVTQARLLAAGDTAGYEEKFGRL